MSAWSITPVSATSSRPVSRSRTISAPWPSADRSAAARATSSATRSTVRCSVGEKSQLNEPDPADPLERAAQLRLEDDDEGEQADDREGLEDLGQEAQVERAGGRVDREQDADADDEADGAGAPDQAEQPVDQERRDPDVDQRGQVDLADDRLEKLRHRPPSLHPREGPAGAPAGRAGAGRAWPVRRTAAATRGSSARRVDDERAEALADRGVVVEVGEPAEEQELLDGLASASPGRGRARRGAGGGPGRTGRGRSPGSRRRPRPTGGRPGGGRGPRPGGRRGPRRARRRTGRPRRRRRGRSRARPARRRPPRRSGSGSRRRAAPAPRAAGSGSRLRLGLRLAARAPRLRAPRSSASPLVGSRRGGLGRLGSGSGCASGGSARRSGVGLGACGRAGRLEHAQRLVEGALGGLVAGRRASGAAR